MSREFSEKEGPPDGYIEDDGSKRRLTEQRDVEKQATQQQQQHQPEAQQPFRLQASTPISSIYTGSNFAHGPLDYSTTAGPKSDPARITPIPDEQITDLPARGGLYRVQSLFDRVLPERRRYCGHSRRYCLVVLGLVMLAILVLIITLSVALTRGKHMRRTNNAPGAPQRGEITYYDPALGACGQSHHNGNAVVAISVAMWNTGMRGANPNNNSNCGRSIMITNVNGRAVNTMVSVADRCTGCAVGDLDVSRSVFSSVTGGNMGLGRTGVEWHFVT